MKKRHNPPGFQPLPTALTSSWSTPELGHYVGNLEGHVIEGLLMPYYFPTLKFTPFRQTRHAKHRTAAYVVCLPLFPIDNQDVLLGYGPVKYHSQELKELMEWNGDDVSGGGNEIIDEARESIFKGLKAKVWNYTDSVIFPKVKTLARAFKITRMLSA